MDAICLDRQPTRATLLTRRPAGHLRAWSAALILVSLGAGMAAQGAHAIWYDERSHHLELPWNVRLLVSFVPPRPPPGW
jgi:hypothetical protein